MGETFTQRAKSTSTFLSPPPPRADERLMAVSARSQPLRSARIIDINKINPDPNQPRQTFDQESLESLAASISELDGIIDPITVEYIEKDDCYRIISGERRYRASKMVGLMELPCIVKEVNDDNRFLMQFIANLQHEDIQPLEEAAGIKHLIDVHGYAQSKMAKLLNKSKSYISQVLGLERLEEPARKIIRNTSIPKEAQIQASRETNPAKQRDILIEASKDGGTIRQIRKKRGLQNRKCQKDQNAAVEKGDPVAKGTKFFKDWTWASPDKSFTVSIKFLSAQSFANRTDLCKKALNAALAGMDQENALPTPLPSYFEQK